MLLFRPNGTPRIDKPALLARVARFFRGDWASLLREACASGAPPPVTCPARDDPEARADRAVRLVRVGEVSAARQALLSEPLVPGDATGDATTLQEPRDPARRPAAPCAPLHQDLREWQPETPVEPARTALLANVRRARRSAAPGPSGLTAELARLLLDDPEVSVLARAQAPASTARAITLGRLVAIRKPSGGVRGIVVGDFLRRLVERAPCGHVRSW